MVFTVSAYNSIPVVPLGGQCPKPLSKTGNNLNILLICLQATYVFIVNLALSDMVMLTFNMPIYLYYIMVNDWVFGRALCHIAYPTFSLPVFVSSWTIMLISLDRSIAAQPGNKYGISRFKVCMSDRSALPYNVSFDPSCHSHISAIYCSIRKWVIDHLGILLFFFK